MMTRQDITKANPHKRPRYQRSKEMQAFINQAEIEAPDLYRQIQQEDAWMRQFEAAAPRVESILNDPTFIEWNRRYEEEHVLEKQKQLKNELAMLGIEAGATKREIYNAYRRKARKLHPDAGGDEAAFKRLHAAYRRLLAAAPA